MSELGTLTLWLWGLTAAIQMLLLFSLVARSNASKYPAFSVYIFATLAQSAALFVVFRRWGFSSVIAWNTGWIAQFLVLGARVIAVAELCRLVLGRFRGIWQLVLRILLTAGFAVLFGALAAAKHQWNLLPNTMEKALELAAAAVIVLLLLFARYYHVAVTLPVRLLGIGLCLYSCVAVVNDTILERWLGRYIGLWNICGMVAFLGCLLLWSWAFRRTVELPVQQPALLDPEVYMKLIPEVNWRLRSLDQQLIHFWRMEAPRA